MVTIFQKYKIIHIMWSIVFVDHNWFSRLIAAHTSIELLRGSRFRRKPFTRPPDAPIAVGHAYLPRTCPILERKREKKREFFLLPMQWPNLTFCSIWPFTSTSSMYIGILLNTYQPDVKSIWTPFALAEFNILLLN